MDGNNVIDRVDARIDTLIKRTYHIGPFIILVILSALYAAISASVLLTSFFYHHETPPLWALGAFPFLIGIWIRPPKPHTKVTTHVIPPVAT